MGSADLSKTYLQVNFTNKKIGGNDEGSGGETVPAAREAWVYAPGVYNPGAQDFTQQSDLNHAFSHELGHLMGLEHSSDGLMNPNFNASDQRPDIGDYLSKGQRQQVQKYLEGVPFFSLDQK
jgi:hypothetical protein